MPAKKKAPPARARPAPPPPARAAPPAKKPAKLDSSPLARRLLAKLRPICLSLPDSTEVEAWGHPTFRVAGKIFAGFGADEETASISVKTSFDLQAALVSSDERFTIAAYVGKHGWVSLDLSKKVDWAEVEALVEESHRLVAAARPAAARARSARKR